ncbi:MAG: metallophosphatase, partial [Planctomycetota bacterium]
VLGDLLHAPVGTTSSLLEAVAEWRAGFPAQIDVVPGNHDRGLHRAAARWDMDVLPATVTLGALTLTHDPDPHQRASGPEGWVAGHLHPVVRLSGGGDALKLPCFWFTRSGLVLPAFSAFTGGGPIYPDRTDRVFAIADDAVIDLS